MSETDKQTVLARMTRAARQERKAKAMTLAKAMRVTLAKVADELMDLPLAVLSVTMQDIPSDALEEALDDTRLQIILDGPRKCTGAIIFEPIVVGALIQQQTICTVLDTPDPERGMTQTDAAICAPLIDTMFTRVARILDEPQDVELMEGYKFGAKAQDSRTLAMVLDASAYVAIRLTLDIARGARQGEVTLILPTVEARDEQQDVPDLSADGAEAGPLQNLSKVVMGLNAELRMVLCRINRPLNALNALRVGDTLPVTPGSFPNVQITTATGRILGRGLVGHVDSVRAVRPLRAPLHSSQPLRRESDKPLVDMPEVEVLTASGKRMTVSRKVDVSPEELATAMQGLPPIEERRSSAPAPSASLNEDMANEIEDIPFPVIDETPQMDDALPDMPDLPSLDDMPELGDLPDLEGLPDLDDIPDLAALPDLEIQAG